MGNEFSPGPLKMVNVSVPEFYFTHLGQAEAGEPGFIRFPCCLHDSGILIPQFIAILPLVRVTPCARLAMHMTAEIFNSHMFRDERMIC